MTNPWDDNATIEMLRDALNWEQEGHALAKKHIAELERERRPLMEFVVCARNMVEEVRGQLAVTKRALEMACKDILDGTHKTYDAFDMRPSHLVLVDDVLADYMKRAKP